MNEFQTAVFVKPGKVLGRQLLPLSAFHASSLLLVGSPYLKDGASISWGDTVTAVLICISRYEDGLDKVLHFQNSWLCRLGWRVRMLFARSDEMVTTISQHISTYFAYPEVWMEKGSGSSKKIGAPWWYFMVSLMWLDTGASLSELWNMSLVELSCHKAIRDELHGGAEIATALMEEMEQANVKN